MKNASCIIAVLSHLSAPEYALEKFSDKPHWAGNNSAEGNEKSYESFLADHEIIHFSSVFSELKGRLEITIVTGDLHAVANIIAPVKACFLFTFTKNKNNSISLPWSSSLS